MRLFLWFDFRLSLRLLFAAVLSILEGLNYTKFSISLREPKLRSDVLYKKEKNIQSYSLFQSKLNQNCFRLKMKPNISKIILIVFSFKSFQSN